MIHFPVAFARVVEVTHFFTKNAGKRGHFPEEMQMAATSESVYLRLGNASFISKSFAKKLYRYNY